MNMKTFYARGKLIQSLRAKQVYQRFMISFDVEIFSNEKLSKPLTGPSGG